MNRSFSSKFFSLHSSLHVAIAAKLLKGILALLVLRSSRTLRCFGSPQFIDNLTHRPGGRFDGKGARRAPQTAITLPLLVREIERDYRDILTLDVFPYVQFRPVQQRMDPDVRTLLKIRFELVP